MYKVDSKPYDNNNAYEPTLPLDTTVDVINDFVYNVCTKRQIPVARVCTVKHGARTRVHYDNIRASFGETYESPVCLLVVVFGLRSISLPAAAAARV